MKWLILTSLFLMLIVNTAFSAVEFISISAAPTGEYVKIDWQTASELNNDYFTVESSTDAIDFTPIAIVDGSGSSAMTSSYSYIDSSTTFGKTYYYRIKQTDFDGDSAYSGIISVEVLTSVGTVELSPLSVHIYPSPVVDELKISIKGFINGSVGLKIVDMQGVVVHSLNEPSADELSIPVNDLNSGVYILYFSSDERILAIEKIVIE